MRRGICKDLVNRVFVHFDDSLFSPNCVHLLNDFDFLEDSMCIYSCLYYYQLLMVLSFEVFPKIIGCGNIINSKFPNIASS